MPDNDTEGHFVFDPSGAAMELLQTLRCPVAPVAVVGKYRTGKSYLLNRLIEYNGGFEVGPTIEACTKGIWLWSEPLIHQTGSGQSVAVLFFDTEGIGAGSASADHDARVFSLATLLTSLLVYNSVGVIDEDAIANLSFIANLTRHVQLKCSTSSGTGAPSTARAGADNTIDGPDSDDDDHPRKQNKHGSGGGAASKPARALGSSRGGGASSSTPRSQATGGDDAEISEFFPSFLWVLRDFTLDLHDAETGEEMSPRDYLESCLQQQAGFSSDAQARNRVRRVLTAFFRDRDCMTLVRPVDDEVELSNVDDMPDNELRPEFRHQLSHLKEHIFTNLIKPKQVNGQFVNGRMLAGLAQAYVAAINDNAVPSIGNAWDGVSRTECLDAYNKCLQSFESGMSQDAHAAALPMDEPELLAVYSLHHDAALAQYDDKAFGPAAERYKSELEGKLSEAYKQLLASNASASEAGCARLVAQLWHEIVEPRLYVTEKPSTAPSAGSQAPSRISVTSSVYSSAEEFSSDMSKLRDRYFADAKGPAVHKAVGLFLLQAMPNVVRAINTARQAESDTRAGILEARLSSVQADLEVAQAKAAVLEVECKDLRQERQSGAVAVAKAEQESKHAREELAILEQRCEALSKERDDILEKLRQEKLAHAETRIQLKAHGGTDTNVTRISNVAAEGSKHSREGGGSMLAGGRKGIPAQRRAKGRDTDSDDDDGVPASSPRPATSATAGGDDGNRRNNRGGLKPSGVSSDGEIGGMGRPVEFPEPPPKACCSVQ